MTCKSQRVNIVRLQSTDNLLPIQGGEFDEKGVEDDKSEGGLIGGDENDDEAKDQWSELQSRVEEMQKKVAEHFEDGNEKQAGGPPVIRQPSQPTQEQWMQLQATHALYEAWCPHCVAARAVRRNHRSKKPRAYVYVYIYTYIYIYIYIVPDTDATREGPVTISMDHMYLHDRAGKYKESMWNPPYFVVVEHRYGRCWVYQVPNKGHMDGAHWFPRRGIQDWDNSGMKETRIILKSDQEPAMTSVRMALQ